MMEVVVTTGAIRCAKFQSNRHHQQTNAQRFTGRMPFLSPNQQCQSTESTYCQLDLFLSRIWHEFRVYKCLQCLETVGWADPVCKNINGRYHSSLKWYLILYTGSDGVLEDMSLASRILEDNFYSPWPWPWPRGSCPWLHHCILMKVSIGSKCVFLVVVVVLWLQFCTFMHWYNSTVIRPPFDLHSTAILPRYDHSTIVWCYRNSTIMPTPLIGALSDDAVWRLSLTSSLSRQQRGLGRLKLAQR